MKHLVLDMLEESKQSTKENKLKLLRELKILQMHETLEQDEGKSTRCYATMKNQWDCQVFGFLGTKENQLQKP